MTPVTKTEGAAQPMLVLAAVLLLVFALPAPAAGATTVDRKVWGLAPSGETVEIYTISNGSTRLEVSNYGARMVSLFVPDRDGRLGNVLLSPSEPEKLTGMWSLAGATIGRFANRIAHGRFALDGVQFTLATNMQGDTLHGGPSGFATRVWRARAVRDGVELELKSPDGDMGFPGELTLRVTYRLEGNERRTAIDVDYEARTDRPTVLNLTNHAFFNLAGQAAPVAGHELRVAASAYTPVGDRGLPSGAVAPVAGTRFDLRRWSSLGRVLAQGPLDANLVLDHGKARSEQSTLRDPASGRRMRLYTSEPGLQVFFLGSLPSMDSLVSPSAICLEPQHFPDSPNQASFPSTVLRPGQHYRSRTRYLFDTIGWR